MLRFPTMFLGGAFFPIEAMPWPLPLIARTLPLTYATEALCGPNMGCFYDVCRCADASCFYRRGDSNRLKDFDEES
ncbi:MAG: hypothetical protein ACUVT5_05465 [Candidatus Bathyarchaeales archaeon]